MKKTHCLATLIVCALGSGMGSFKTQAQEVIPKEEALKASFLLWNTAGKLEDLAIKVDADIKNPFGMSKEDIGMVVIPETKLADVLTKAGEKVLPLGQLWLKGLVPEVDGKEVPDSKLKLIDVTAKNDTASVVLCTLGVRKTEKNGLEMVVYGKDKEPLTAVPLKTMKSGDQEQPIEFAVVPGSGNAQIVLKVLGKYEAELTVRK